MTEAAAQRIPIRRALLGVYDKTGIEDLARALAAAGVELVSTGATARRIAEAGVPVTPVEKVTGFPECLDGRVKTLHPAVHAGILADRRKPEHVAQLDDLGIAPFDLVVVNLYPFRETVASGATPDECVEQIDIGGPAMVRAAAKNHPSVAVVVDPARYADVVAALDAGGFSLDERRRLAADAFRHTASYDIAVASWMGDVLAPDDDGSGFPHPAYALASADSALLDQIGLAMGYAEIYALTDTANRVNAVVYSVALDSSKDSMYDVPQDAILDELPRITGGRRFSADDPEKLRDVFATILAEFRQRYILSYSPQGVDRAGYHALDVRLARGRKGEVHARPGYMRS